MITDKLDKQIVFLMTMFFFPINTRMPVDERIYNVMQSLVFNSIIFAIISSIHVIKYFKYFVIIEVYFGYRFCIWKNGPF